MALSVGVLGGLGPAATLDFHAALLRLQAARTDQEHIRLLIDSDPGVPDRNAALRGEGESPGPHLARMAAGLERAGADFLVLACNAAHAWQAEIEAAVSIPFVSMIDEVVREAATHGPARVGLLAADATLDAGLYQRAFGSAAVETVHPDRAEFMALLYRIKAGDTGSGVSAAMRALADTMTGIDVLIAACTEVPLVLTDHELPYVNSTDVLARATLRAARQG